MSTMCCPTHTRTIARPINLRNVVSFTCIHVRSSLCCVTSAAIGAHAEAWRRCLLHVHTRQLAMHAVQPGSGPGGHAAGSEPFGQWWEPAVWAALPDKFEAAIKPASGAPSEQHTSRQPGIIYKWPTPRVFKKACHSWRMGGGKLRAMLGLERGSLSVSVHLRLEVDGHMVSVPSQVPGAPTTLTAGADGSFSIPNYVSRVRQLVLGKALLGWRVEMPPDQAPLLVALLRTPPPGSTPGSVAGSTTGSTTGSTKDSTADATAGVASMHKPGSAAAASCIQASQDADGAAVPDMPSGGQPMQMNESREPVLGAADQARTSGVLSSKAVSGRRKPGRQGRSKQKGTHGTSETWRREESSDSDIGEFETSRSSSGGSGSKDIQRIQLPEDPAGSDLDSVNASTELDTSATSKNMQGLDACSDAGRPTTDSSTAPFHVKNRRGRPRRASSNPQGTVAVSADGATAAGTDDASMDQQNGNGRMQQRRVVASSLRSRRRQPMSLTFSKPSDGVMEAEVSGGPCLQLPLLQKHGIQVPSLVLAVFYGQSLGDMRKPLKKRRWQQPMTVVFEVGDVPLGPPMDTKLFCKHWRDGRAKSAHLHVPESIQASLEGKHVSRWVCMLEKLNGHTPSILVVAVA